jgi:hypothetical protein
VLRWHSDNQSRILWNIVTEFHSCSVIEQCVYRDVLSLVHINRAEANRQLHNLTARKRAMKADIFPASDDVLIRDILAPTLAYAHRSVIPEIGLRLRTDLTRIGVRTDTSKAERTKYGVDQARPGQHCRADSNTLRPALYRVGHSAQQRWHATMRAETSHYVCESTGAL